MVRDEGTLAGSARLARMDGAALFRPDEQMFEAMFVFCGGATKGLARNLVRTTVQARERQVRAFQVHSGTFPWEWATKHSDEWLADLRAVHHCTRSTVRGYQVAVRGFSARSRSTGPTAGRKSACAASGRTRCRSSPMLIPHSTSRMLNRCLRRGRSLDATCSTRSTMPTSSSRCSSSSTPSPSLASSSSPSTTSTRLPTESSSSGSAIRPPRLPHPSTTLSASTSPCAATRPPRPA